MMMNYFKLIIILTCYLLIFSQQTVAQFFGLGYNPYGEIGALGGMLGSPGRYPMHDYYPQYSVFGSYPCYTSIYCGGNYYGYLQYLYYGNSFRSSFSTRSSSGFFSHYTSNGGFFG